MRCHSTKLYTEITQKTINLVGFEKIKTKFKHYFAGFYIK